MRGIQHFNIAEEQVICLNLFSEIVQFSSYLLAIR